MGKLLTLTLVWDSLCRVAGPVLRKFKEREEGERDRG